MRAALCLISVAFALAQDAPPELKWTPAARMAAGRVDHCAVTLKDGRILVAGGAGPDGPLATVEIYGPEDAFTAAPPMTAARTRHTCTVLPDGLVLAAGGAAGSPAEIFDPETSEWTSVEGGEPGREGHTATPLPGGRVLLAGGLRNGEPAGLLEIFDPNQRRITGTAAGLSEPRAQHGAAALPDGRVLLVGGSGASGPLASAEIYDPQSDTARQAPPMALPRAGLGVAALVDGRVLVLGGSGGAGELGNAEIYHPQEDRWEWVAAGMNTPRRDAFVTVIPGSGLVLIAGGEYSGTALGDTEVFEPWSSRFVAIGSLTAPRARIAGAALADGAILATGGRNDAGASAACGRLSTAALVFTSRVYLPGQTAVADGSGFAISGGITDGSSNTILLPENPAVTLSLRLSDGTPANNRLLTTTAALTAGAFRAKVMEVGASDLGKRFILRAQLGLRSAEAFFDVGAPVAVSGGPTAAASIAGRPIPFDIRLNPEQNVGSMNGTLTVRVGATSRNLFLLAQTPGSRIPFSFCCVSAPGTYPVTISYANDTKYSPASVTIAAHNVVSPQVNIGLGARSLPLFTDVDVAVTVSAPVSGVPAPTGSVTVSRSGFGPLTLPLAADPRSFGLGALASFKFRATFAERPSACFTVQYSGNRDYPASSASVCAPTAPATPQLAISATGKTYTFGAFFPVEISLTFPAELGVLTRSVTLQPLGITAPLAVQVGRAEADVSLAMPFNATSVQAQYPGGGDLGPATASLSVAMAPVTTTTTLDPLSSQSKNPLTLNARVAPVLPKGVALPLGTGVAGVVQFFDGDLLIGQVGSGTTLQIVGADGALRVSLANVIRPVGTRSFRAVFLGSALFASSQSASVQTVIQ